MMHRTASRYRMGVAAVVVGLNWLAAAAATTPAIAVNTDGTSVTVAAGKRLLLEYRYGGDPFKPYVRRWTTPAGVQVLRDSPHDHVHHHALMFAIGAGGVDFWSENKKCGRQVHRSFDGAKTVQAPTGPGVVIGEKLDWLGPDKAGILVEKRTIRLDTSHPQGASLLTWQTALTPAKGRKSVKLHGSHYFGLGMRFVVPMDKGGRFFNPTRQAGKTVRGTERLVAAPWCAYTAKADGKVVTVAMFDHPGNARPALWFTMTGHFAYLSATTNLWKQPAVLPAGGTLELVYGVALWDGQAKPDAIEKLYKHWLAAAPKPATVPKQTVRQSGSPRPASDRPATLMKGASLSLP